MCTAAHVRYGVQQESVLGSVVFYMCLSLLRVIMPARLCFQSCMFVCFKQVISVTFDGNKFNLLLETGLVRAVTGKATVNVP